MPDQACRCRVRGSAQQSVLSHSARYKRARLRRRAARCWADGRCTIEGSRSSGGRRDQPRANAKKSRTWTAMETPPKLRRVHQRSTVIQVPSAMSSKASSSKASHAIGWIGLGRMGEAMAARLIKAGHGLSVWNRTASKADPLARLGAEVVTDKTAMAHCETV